jgi:hypothetical protein
MLGVNRPNNVNIIRAITATIAEKNLALPDGFNFTDGGILIHTWLRRFNQVGLLDTDDKQENFNFLMELIALDVNLRPPVFDIVKLFHQEHALALTPARRAWILEPRSEENIQRISSALHDLKCDGLLTVEHIEALDNAIAAQGIQGFNQVLDDLQAAESARVEAARAQAEQDEIKQTRVSAKNNELTRTLNNFKAILSINLDGNHEQKIDKIKGKIEAKCRPMVGVASEADVTEFKAWFNQMMLEEKKKFELAPSVWHDTIRPALVKLVGVLCGVILSPCLLFSPRARNYVSSFFKEEPKPEAQFEEIMQKQEDAVSDCLVCGA